MPGLGRLLVMMASRSGVPIEYLAVAGGAAGGSVETAPFFGAGGGAGEVVPGTLTVRAGDAIAITVGAGGAFAPGDDGRQGGDSTFGGVTANGGHGGGRSVNSGNGSPGHSGPGCGGGGGGTGAGGGSPGGGGTGTTSNGAAGATSGGGGGGAGGSAVSNVGGTGVTSSISGAAVAYGWGGNLGAGSYTPGTGGDGEGAGGTNAGADGLVIVRYPTGALNAIGGSKSTVGGYTVHTFGVGSSTFTVIS